MANEASTKPASFVSERTSRCLRKGSRAVLCLGSRYSAISLCMIFFCLSYLSFHFISFRTRFVPCAPKEGLCTLGLRPHWTLQSVMHGIFRWNQFINTLSSPPYRVPLLLPMPWILHAATQASSLESVHQPQYHNMSCVSYPRPQRWWWWRRQSRRCLAAPWVLQTGGVSTLSV